jgi:uncharacterized delta-60 repeat protein
MEGRAEIGGRIPSRHMKPSIDTFKSALHFICRDFGQAFLTALTLFAFFAFTAAPTACGAAGDLDPNFGHQGKVLSDFGGTNDFAYATALQSDGRIVTAGFRYSGDTSSGGDILVARYNRNGTLDTTFGAGGRVVTDLGLTDAARALIIQPDGKILVAGVTFEIYSVFGEIALVRYNPDGSLDTTFGSGGIVISFFGDQGCQANSVALQGDGKIVVGGSLTVDFIIGEQSDVDFLVARYNTDGSLDSSFGNGGFVSTDFFQLDDSAAAVLIQPDNKIVAVGTSEGLVTYFDFALVRYLANGQLDTSFGRTGKVFTDLRTQDGEGAATAVLQPDGRIIAGGSSSAQNGQDPFTLIRYNPNGRLDGSFGERGVVKINFGVFLQSCSGLVLQPDGKIVAAGFASSEGPSDDFLLARILGNGQLDPSFGVGGKVDTSFGNLNGGAFGVLRQPDGKIVAAGFQATNTEGSDVAIARYLGN